jgi:guanosine-3',5'-bis(diphosphate) 3'-pyrophosphohydrolase
MLRPVPDGTSTETDHQAPRFVAASPLIASAYRLAAEAHSGQRRRDDGSPYISHPVAVAQLLHDAGFRDQVIAAALLHDVVEDTEMSTEEVAERFCDEVAKLVDALSEDEGIEDFSERKREHREQVEESTPEAVAIYVADKLSNLRDLRSVYAEEGETVASRFKAPLDVRVELWREDAEMALRLAPELPYLDEFRSELSTFAEERRASLEES